MSTNEILSRDNELLILVRTPCLCRYYNLFYIVIMTCYLVRTIYYLVFTKYYAVITTERKFFLDIFKVTAKINIGKIGKFQDFLSLNHVLIN